MKLLPDYQLGVVFLLSGTCYLTKVTTFISIKVVDCSNLISK